MIRKGDRLNETYRILEPMALGEGTAGVVYLGWHEHLQKKVVIKKIRDHYVGKINERREADILKKLHHRYLPQVYDFIQKDGAVYTVIDYIEGNTMTDYIRAKVRFDEAQIIRWLRQLLEALEYLHSQKPPIIHGDIKPSNIMIAENGDICLIDFNISFGQDEERPTGGYTEAYASPEQTYRAKLYSSGGNYQDIVLDARSDLFSLAASIYNLMTGVNAVARIRNRRPLFAGQSDYSEELCRIVSKALEVRPSNRYQSAREMRNDLLTIKKRDREYRKLQRTHFIVSLVGILGLAAGLTMAFVGNRYRAADSYHEEAVTAREYYASSQYDDAITAAEKALSDSSSYKWIRGEYPGITEELFEIAAESAFEKDEDEAEKISYNKSGDYTESISWFKDLISFCEDAETAENTERSETAEEADDAEGTADTQVVLKAAFYRDLAIAQARDETTDDDDADSTLLSAEEKGFSDASLLLARAEIALDRHNSGTTVSEAQKVLDGNPTDEEKYRAYIVRARGYYMGSQYEDCVYGLQEACGDSDMQESDRYEEALLNELEVACEKILNEGSVPLSDEEKEQYYEIERDAWQETYNRKTKNGTMTVSDYVSYANALVAGVSEEETFIKAQQVLYDAKADDPNLESDYRIWTELALLEADKIGKADENKVQDYTMFLQYYEKAMGLYEQSGATDDSGDVAKLEDTYQRLKTAGKF